MAYEAEGYSEVIDGVVVQVEQGLDMGRLADDPQVRQLASAVNTWMNDIRGGERGNPRGNMLSRQLFNPPPNVYSEMRAARQALRVDDIVSGVAESTEAFAFQKVRAECKDEDTNDIIGQINDDIGLASLFRKMWRETFALNFVVLASKWGEKDYQLKGQHADTGRNKKTTKFKGLKVPTKVVLLDPLCVLPVQNGPLGDEMLLWSASQAELAVYLNANTVDSPLPDVPMSDFFIGRFEPNGQQIAQFYELGFTNTDRLLIMNPKYVRRYCSTKSDYELFPDIRLKSIFALLDLKRQLLDQDRVNLVGAANFILLIRKGDKDLPATGPEMDNLKNNYQVMAKLPVIIADHRLSIEIIAPKIDLVLVSEKYDLIDVRILHRLLGTLSMQGKGQRNETNITVSYAVARGMESRREMMADFIEEMIYDRIVEENPGKFPVDPEVTFVPARIALGFDSALAQMLQSLFASNDLSRETALEFVGLDQATEALRKQIEKDLYDGKVFDSVLPPGAVKLGPDGQPVSTDPAAPADPAVPPAKKTAAPAKKAVGQPIKTPAGNGAKGGRPTGGGKTKPGTITPKTPAGNPSTKRSGS